MVAGALAGPPPLPRVPFVRVDGYPQAPGEGSWRVMDDDGFRLREPDEGETPNRLMIMFPGDRAARLIPVTLGRMVPAFAWGWDGNRDSPTLEGMFCHRASHGPRGGEYVTWRGHIRAGSLEPAPGP